MTLRNTVLTCKRNGLLTLDHTPSAPNFEVNFPGLGCLKKRIEVFGASDEGPYFYLKSNTPHATPEDIKNIPQSILNSLQLRLHQIFISNLSLRPLSQNLPQNLARLHHSSVLINPHLNPQESNSPDSSAQHPQSQHLRSTSYAY
jgi:hypothetical protein